VADWRRLHNEDLHNLYASPNIVIVIKSNKDEMVGACSMHGKDEKSIKKFGRET
jgi:hypothetical protein